MSALTSIHPVARALLERRGITERGEMERFLAPSYERDIYDPMGILNMKVAIDRIEKAMRKNERIVIFGDYDCDGIPGSVILHDLFKKIGYRNFENYIPHRHREGYGLNEGAIERFAREGVTLLITVDCGITDIKETELANTLGIDVIITDHHLPGPTLPPAFTIINSKQENDVYPDRMLSGAGVAWKIAQALLATRNFAHIPAGWEKWLLDMAGIAAIADMVPLQNENRAIAHFGLRVLRRSPRPGLAALLSLARKDQRYLTEEDIGFTIGPRVNAASRMGDPGDAFHMLASQDPAFARSRAEELERLNDERKALVARLMKEARRQVEGRAKEGAIVLGNPLWPVGVVGIVAGQLVERYGVPAFVWGGDAEGGIKGSCRSDGTVNMVEWMRSTPEGTFLDCGGHEGSGGFSVARGKVHALPAALLGVLPELPRHPSTKKTLDPDLELPLSAVGDAHMSAIELLAPFGEGNARPIFLFSDAAVTHVERFGKGKEHLRLRFTDGAFARPEAIAFFKTEDDYPDIDLSPGTRVDLLANMERSYFRGRGEVRLRIAEILPK